jgi:hypothetical protein
VYRHSRQKRPGHRSTAAGHSVCSGHDRWDLNHSIGSLRPDIVTGLPLRSADSEYLRRAGYSQLPSTVFVRLDSDRVDATLLMQSLAGRQTAAR